MHAFEANARKWGVALLLTGMLLAAFPRAATGTWLPVGPDGGLAGSGHLTPQAPRVRVAHFDSQGLSLNVTVAGLELTRAPTAQGEFVDIGWPEAVELGNVGEPSLPVVRRLIAVPVGATVFLEVTPGQPVVADLAALGYPRAVLPQQAPQRGEPADWSLVPFAYEPAAYAAHELWPTELAEVSELGIVRGQRLCVLEVRPVAYQAAAGTLVVWPEIDVTVHFEGGSGWGGPGPRTALGSTLLNPPSVAAASAARAGGNYLIIVGEPYAGSAPLSTFVAAKTAAGFAVAQYTVTAGMTNADIRAYITSLWGTANAPDYILLVGDTDTVPHWVGAGGGAATTDLPYACMDGASDFLADIAIGRFSVRSVAELDAMVDKTLAVAEGSFSDPNYVLRAAFMCGTDTTSGDEDVHNWVIDTHLAPRGYRCDKLYMRSYGATTQDVRDAFNEGCVYGVFFGHSFANQWSNGPAFSHADVEGLTNAGLYAFVFGFTCSVADFARPDWEPCFAEKWTRVANKGAAATIGASIHTYYHPDGWIETINSEKYLFNAIYLDGIREISPAWQAAMLRFAADYPPNSWTAREYAEMFNLLGDPALQIPMPPPPVYLIVTAPDYARTAPLNAFAQSKRDRGFSVRTYVVPAGTTNAAIKTEIQHAWGTAAAPSYILIVGDTDGSTSTQSCIPHWTGAGTRHADTDLPYACMDAGDDWYPDVAIGRFPVRTLTQLDNMVQKTIQVESGNFSDPDYVRRAALLATDDSDAQGNANHDWVVTNYLAPADFTCTKIYANQGGDTGDVTAAVNAGQLFTVYIGHSSSSGWWAPSFEQDNVQLLSNAGLYGLVFGFSCNSAQFSSEECFGETWVREANKGAAAYLSASNYVWWGSVEAWESSRRMERYFFQSFFEDGIWEVGPAWQAACYRILHDPDFGPAHDHTRNIFEEFVLLGDPSLLLPRGGGFALKATPESRSVCCPPVDAVTYVIDVEQYADFDEVVTLTAQGAPAGTTIAFDGNNQQPPFSSLMTVSGLLTAAPATYTIQVSGTSTTKQRTIDLGLFVSHSAPPTVVLTSPAAGATDVARQPTLTWQAAAEAAEYDVEVARDAGFTNVVWNATVSATNCEVGITLDSLTEYFWRVQAVNACGESGFSAPRSFTTLSQADAFTQEFTASGGDTFDLDNFSVTFYPDGSGDYYGVCGESIGALPTDPAGGTTLSVGEDSSVVVTPSSPVSLYGVSYSSFWVNANGNITFDTGDGAWTETLALHFSQPRVSGVYHDFSPQINNAISRKSLADRIAVTWLNARQYNQSDSNTFQIELFFDGQIRISWLRVDASAGIVGLSAGEGIPSDYVESDLSSAGPCAQAGFTVDATPGTREVCAPNDAVYLVKVDVLQGYSDPVTLSSSGAPAGTLVDFSVNNTLPPFTSTMTISGTGGAVAGTYAIEVIGTGPEAEESDFVELRLSSDVPGTAALTSPADGATATALTPTLTWEALAAAVQYDVEVATDPNFQQVVVDTVASGTSYAIPTPLAPQTLHYWRVRGTSYCGAGPFSSTFSFTTGAVLLAASYDTLNGEAGTYNYFDDTYDGTGEVTVPLAPLTGGLGDLTDGVVATGHWNQTPVPYVGWSSIEPTITFHFSGAVTLDAVTLYVDDASGGGGVVPPSDVRLVMGGAQRDLEVTDPPASEPFAIVCTDLNLVGDTLAVTLLDDEFTTSRYMMLCEVEFFGQPNTGACCTGETCTLLSESACASAGGVFQGLGADCDPNPCLEYESVCLIISEIVQGTLSGNCPTWIEITNTGLRDFAFVEGGIIVQSGTSSDVAIDVDLSGVTIAAGQAYVVNSNQLGACSGAFSAIYGFAPGFVTNVDFGSGYDRFILTDTADGSHLLDIYGEFGVAGNGKPWAYAGGYAHRLPTFAAGAGAAFVETQWFFGGEGSLNGADPEQLLLDLTTPGAHVHDYNCCTSDLPGDMNCDGVIDFADINPFVRALTEPTVWHVQYPGCDIMNGDLSGDGVFNFADINPFVGLIVQGPPGR